MSSFQNKNRNNIFYEELLDLRRQNLINDQQYNDMLRAYFALQEQRKYYEANLAQQISVPEIPAPSQVSQHQTVTAEHSSVVQPPLVSKTVQNETKKVEKKVKSEEEIRERNITWTLILGVIMLLTAGLILSTSNWQYMNDILKVISIASVSILFLVLSWFTEKILKIKKTSFAFLVLGSSFVPIVFIGIGFFMLFGLWLSFFGDGKYVLGLIGSITSCIVYSINAKRLNSRLFKWLSLITVSFIVAFGLAAMKLSIDAFYLGIIVYNAVLLFGYHKYKSSEKLQWIAKEIPLFSQINLILSSILVLFFFEQSVFYSFNIIAVSILYISMMYISQSKHYHFAFTAFVTYGFYQLATHTPLDFMGEIIIASIALIFLALQFYQKNNENLKRIYQWTCAVISFLAFVYISIHSLFIGWESNSMVMFISYLILSVNYVYLSHITKTKIFPYLANMFAILSIFPLFDSISILSDYFVAFHFVLVSALLYMLYFKRKPFTYFVRLQTPALIVSSIAYMIIILVAMLFDEWLNATIISFLVAIIFYLTTRKADNAVTKFYLWCAPLMLMLSGILLYEYLSFEQYGWHVVYPVTSIIDQDKYAFILHMAITSVAILLISKLIPKWRILSTSTFTISQVVYGIILVSLPISYVAYEFISIPIIMLLSLYMAYELIKKTVKEKLWILFAILASLFYFSLTYLIDEYSGSIIMLNLFLLLYHAVFLIVAQVSKATIKPYFYWVSLVFSVLAYLYALSETLLDFDAASSLLFAIPLIIYSYCAIKGNSELKIKLNLYLALLSLPIFMNLITLEFFPEHDNLRYITMYAGLIMFGLWLFTNQAWKSRVDAFVIPFLIVANAMALISSSESYIISNILMVFSIVISLFLAHRKKWEYLVLLSLIELTILIITLSELYNFTYPVIAVIVSATILVIYFISLKTNKMISYSKYFDWYFIMSFVLIAVLEFYMSNEQLYLRLVPSILLSVILFVTVKRVSTKLTARVIKTLFVSSLFVVYYKIFFEFYHDIWTHIKLELLLLPFIIAIIFLKKRVWDNEKVMQMLEWIVLSSSAIIIVIDCIVANTVVDTIIMGVIGLLAVIAGMSTRIKSYFFIGSAMVLVTLYTQTRPFWGSMPWWIYLLVGGIVLILLASFYEWQKQNANVVKGRWLKLKERFSQWK